MKNLANILAIIFFAACIKTTDNKQTNDSNHRIKPLTESEYIKVRNNSIEYFANLFDVNRNNIDEILKQDSDSLLVLEKMLREILKNSGIDSVVEFGKINLETLMPELGFGMLDGLTLNDNSKQILVTSKVLFFDYFKSDKISTIHKLSSKQLSSIFSSLIADARSSVYYSESFYTKNNSYVYGCIGIIAQDIGRITPDNVFVLIANGDFIYIVQKYLDKPINEISKCQIEYDSINTIGQKHFETYIASNLKNERAIENKFEIEEVAWEKYLECYQQNFRTDHQYYRVKKEIEMIVEYVEQKITDAKNSFALKEE